MSTEQIERALFWIFSTAFVFTVLFIMGSAAYEQETGKESPIALGWAFGAVIVEACIAFIALFKERLISKINSYPIELRRPIQCVSESESTGSPEILRPYLQANTIAHVSDFMYRLSSQKYIVADEELRKVFKDNPLEAVIFNADVAFLIGHIDRLRGKPNAILMLEQAAERSDKYLEKIHYEIALSKFVDNPAAILVDKLYLSYMNERGDYEFLWGSLIGLSHVWNNDLKSAKKVYKEYVVGFGDSGSKLDAYAAIQVALLAAGLQDIELMDKAFSLARAFCKAERFDPGEFPYLEFVQKQDKKFIEALFGFRLNIQIEKKHFYQWKGHAKVLYKLSKLVKRSPGIISSIESLSKSWKEPQSRQKILDRLSQFERSAKSFELAPTASGGVV